MQVSLTIMVENGQVRIEGPIQNVLLCLDLMNAATKALFAMQQQTQAQNELRPLLYMPDGSPARINGTN